MKWIFRILFFAILFNISLFFIASTGFFPYTVTGDAFEKTGKDLSDPDSASFPTPWEVFKQYITNGFGNLPVLGTNTVLNIGVIFGAFAAIGLVAGYISQGSGPIIASISIIGIIFYLMWANSKDVIYTATEGLSSSVNYLILMMLFGALMMFVITAMDYASGQTSGD